MQPAGRRLGPVRTRLRLSGQNSKLLPQRRSEGRFANDHARERLPPGFARFPSRAIPGARMNLQFHLISFEGPDSYCRAGGLSTRVSGLASGLVGSGFETHVWFVGDPDLVGHEQVGNLHLHRWCQWLSSYHRAGVYDGEEVKRVDLAESLPPFLLHQVLRQHVENGGAGVVLAEEWQTADAVLHLDWLLRCEGLRDRTCVLWNANNTFGFDRIDWPRLNQAVMITTVSRFMKHQMWKIGVDPIVIPNGLTPDGFCLPQPRDVSALRGRSRGRLL